MFDSLSYLQHLFLAIHDFFVMHAQGLLAVGLAGTVWYCMIIRIQHLQQEQATLLVSRLKTGVVVRTSTGLCGSVIQIFEKTVVIADNTRGPVEVFKHLVTMSVDHDQIA